MATYPASDYPGASDTDIPTVSSGDSLDTAGKEHATLHNALRNSILAIQDTLGIYARGILIARTSYDPGSLASYTTSSTSIADVDATNLVVTFTAPASGSVMIRLEGHGGYNASYNDGASWGLRSGSTTVAILPTMGGVTSSVTTGPNSAHSKTFFVSSLTPGASYTYKWAWQVSSGATTARLYAGPGAAPAHMLVHIN